MEDEAPVQAGSVRLGFTDAPAPALRAQPDAIRTAAPAVRLKKRIVWVDPVLVAEVEFRGWTGDGKLRHASCDGLRDGEDAAEMSCRELQTVGSGWP